MKKNSVIAKVAAIAALNPSGFTVDAATLQPVTAGYAVAMKTTQNSFGAKGLKKVVSVINDLIVNAKKAGYNLDNFLAYGGWYDSESGLYYYDATLIYQDREKAIEAGRANEQIAIFDLSNLEEIRL